MKRFLVITLAGLAANRTLAQYHPIDKASVVQFKIKNLGFNVTGSLSGLSGTIRFDPAQPENASFDVTVDANTINTDNTMRDNHLRQGTYFDVPHYARISLTSGKVSPSRKGSYLLTGRLTIKNHTKDVSFLFTATEANGGYRFQGSFTINRKDFEIGGFSPISDQLEVSLDVTAK